MRYAPLAAPWDEAGGADGLFIDVTGAVHLFGGEAALLADLDPGRPPRSSPPARRLRRCGPCRSPPCACPRPPCPSRGASACAASAR
jgi:hypothetical protein